MMKMKVMAMMSTNSGKMNNLNNIRSKNIIRSSVTKYLK